MKTAVHICCAVCAAGAVERLLQEGHSVEGYFYNPNLYPESEYVRRLENAQIVAKELGFKLTEGPRNYQDWDRAIVGLEYEPEGGARCPLCFSFRLAQTYKFMQDSGCELYTTTLTMGSNKSGVLISRLGHEIGGERFLERDFKKKAGFRRAGELAGRWGLYRQHYCGCRFSLAKIQLGLLDRRGSP
jgi:epoxyqueuosine reductase